MTGHEVLWIPGTDHAAIATENVVIKHLGLKSREELSREDFLTECRKFAGEKHDTIIGQTKKMGTWLDWSREAYTFDEERNHAVNTIFVQLYKDGLIERGHRMINWSVGAKSVLSDDELEWEERTETLYHIRVGDFIMSTVRPETKCANSPVVVNPKDPRYKHLIGKEFEFETYAGMRKFWVIGDDHIDPEFGTGVMTISPAHDANDYEIAKRHNLAEKEYIQKIDFEGKMTAIAGECAGLPVLEARKKAVEIMREKGLLIKEEEYTHEVPVCYRSGCVVEPMISPQWFVMVEKEFEINHLQKFIYARHGKTDANVDGTVQGVENHLNQDGKNHAKKLAEVLKSKKISKIISSSHLRAKETAEIVAKELRVKNIEFWQELDGHDAGKLTGKKKISGKLVLEWAEEEKTGETIAEFYARIKKGFEKLKDEKEGGEILVIGHRTVFSALDCLEENKSVAEFLESRRRNENRSHGIWSEPSLVSNQRIQTTLKKLTADAVREGHVKIIPERFNKIYFQWIDNLRDWCISRQIWWGHQIPVFYDEKDEIAAVGSLTPEQKKQNLRQDKDTLDTWFSSALWPFSTLNWPTCAEASAGRPNDFDKFYPNDVLETGHDILFFWVARMIMFGRYATGKYPFKNVYLHGLVCDEHGKKMSKSKGNGIDPLDVIAEFGADPVRLALVIGSSPGQKIPIGKEKIAGYRNFVNKLWNAGRFVQMTSLRSSSYGGQANSGAKKSEIMPKTIPEKWIWSRFATVSSEIKNHLDKFEISHAGDKMYHFVWDEFCDWYLEASKVDGNPDFLAALFFEILALVHPFCPFVTEKLFNEFGEEFIMEHNFPRENFHDAEAEEVFNKIKEVVFQIRKIRADEKINPKEKLMVETLRRSVSTDGLIENLAGVKFAKVSKFSADATKIIVGDWEIAVKIPVDENRQKAEIKRLEGEIKNFEARLSNKKYVDNAPKKLVDETKGALEKAKEKLAKIA